MNVGRRKEDVRPTKSIHPAHTTDSEVEEWRRERLLDVGLSPAAAAEIASDRRYDLHALLVLTDRGCDPALAVRIVAPLDEDPVRC